MVKDRPALLGYYLFDEPYPGRPNQAPADLKRGYDILCDEDPFHPVGTLAAEWIQRKEARFSSKRAATTRGSRRS